MHLFSHTLTTRAGLCTQILPKTIKKKIQIMQHKYRRFCLRLDKIKHISLAEFRSINWLPTKERVHQCINAITFKFANKTEFFEIFEFSPDCRIDTRNRFAKMMFPFHKTNTGQETWYIGPLLWHNLPETIKRKRII